MDELTERLRRAAALAVERARSKLGSAASMLEGLSPLKVLGRGYSLTRRLEDLALVLDAAQVSRGDWIITEVERGRIVSRVESAGRSAPGKEGASDE